MPNSQNGWPVVGPDAVDRGPLVRDVTVPNGVLRGDVAVVFRWLAGEYDRRVERLVAGWCWGWHVKNIEGSTAVSNHASATAVDFNAPNNPMGVPTRQSMSAGQIEQCHQLERESDGVLRWGGDFSRPDPMHWEIVGTRVQVAALARKIKGGLPVEQAEFNRLMTGFVESEAGRAALHRVIKTVAEVDPATGQENYRWGGAIRMLNQRRDEQTERIEDALGLVKGELLEAIQGAGPADPPVDSGA